MVPPERIPALFARAAMSALEFQGPADLAVIEGVMGLYDGFGYDDETGSTAHVAKLLGAPVVLVLDARSMARSAAALALGYLHFDPALSLAGFIVNRVGSDRHGRGVAAAITQATGLPVFGWLPRDTALEIPERHLGLVPTAEPGRWQAFIATAAERVARHLDLEGLLRVARSAPRLVASGPPLFPSTPGARPVIAIARDEAFSFTYPDNVDLLQAAGAEIAYFSPLRDPRLPDGTSGIVLSGGFPELYAGPLSVNTDLRQALRQAHERGLPIYAECGGLMYLTQSITDLDGQKHPMMGLLPGRSVMTRRLTLGYRQARAAASSWLLTAGEEIRGHEFHYSSWTDRPADLPPAYHLLLASGEGEPRPEGACLGSLWASYVHLHFWHKPELALRFVEACSAHGRART
jgi:cobyrinic acid a,c-diamide synthase